MIKLTDGDKFETARSLKQELTFEATTLEFSRRGVEFGQSQTRTQRFLASCLSAPKPRHKLIHVGVLVLLYDENQLPSTTAPNTSIPSKVKEPSIT